MEILYFADKDSGSRLNQGQLAPSLNANFTVVDGLSAGLALLEERQFDIALLDLALPGSRDIRSLDLLRHQAPSLPVIVISPVVDDPLALDLLERGVQDCLANGPGLAAKINYAIRFAIHRRQTEADLAFRTKQIETSKAYSENLLRSLQKTGVDSGLAPVRIVLEACADAVVVADDSGQVLYLNLAAERMFGRSPEQWVGKPFGLHLPSGKTGEIEFEANGRTCVAEMRVNSIEWDGGSARLAWMRDISGRKRMEETLLRSEKLQALDTLAGGIAHDFNNILLAITGNAKLALAQLPQDHPAYANALEIAKAGSRAVALTRKILSFSRHEEIKVLPIELPPVVEETIALLRASLPARIQISASIPSSLPPVLADSSQLQEAIVNLATNAADALGDRPGLLQISASLVHISNAETPLSSRLTPGTYLKLAVHDNGSGMDRATLARAFEPFFTTKPQGRGTGMGLAVVHGIMKSHLGDVTVYSEVGKGTVFNLYFPAARKLSPASPEPCSPIPCGKGQRILYVDDEEPLVVLITRILNRLGYDVIGFTDPVKALQAFRESPSAFDAVVTDLSMPAMSGTELARALKKIRPALPLIITSGFIRPQDQEQAREAGVRDLILKPDTVDELGHALHRLLG